MTQPCMNYYASKMMFRETTTTSRKPMRNDEAKRDLSIITLNFIMAQLCKTSRPAKTKTKLEGENAPKH